MAAGHLDFTEMDRRIGICAALAVFVSEVAYAPVLVLGFLALKSPEEPIPDPYFSILELIIIVMAPLLVVLMVVVHAYAPRDRKTYSLTALVFMTILAGITSCVHFVILTVSRQMESTGLLWLSFLFSFRWPSVVYALDILAWDLFFGLSMLFAAPVFKIGRLERLVRFGLVLSGVLSLAGLIGPVTGNMQLRNIGIVGYVGVFSVVCLLLAETFRRTRRPESRDGNASPLAGPRATFDSVQVF